MWPKMTKTRLKKPPKYAAMKRLCLSLPSAVEIADRHGQWFNVGKKTFALYWSRGDKWILKLPKHQVMMLIEARPEIFTPMRAGAMLWAYVDVTKLNAGELRDYVAAAWRCVVPKKVSREFFPDEPRPG
jgi:hypothetical protein